MGDIQDFLWDKESLGKNVFITSPDQTKQKIEDVQAYASFGDGGTTVSLKSYGNIVQMAGFLNFGASGFLCADAKLENPYYVQERMETLMKSLKDSSKGLRLDLVDWDEFQGMPSLGFMYDRWPRYMFERRMPTIPANTGDVQSGKTPEVDKDSNQSRLNVEADLGMTGSTKDAGEPDESKSNAPAFPLSIQYFCSGGTVIQKHLINIGRDGVPYEKIHKRLSIVPDICIRGLDFVKYHDFNDTRAVLDTFVVSKNHFVITHDLQWRDKEDLILNGMPDDTSKIPVAAALIISPFIDGKPAEINVTDEGSHINLDVTPEQTRLDITVVYTLKLPCEDKTLVAEASRSSDSTIHRETGSTQDKESAATSQSLAGYDTAPSVKDEAVFTVQADVFTECLVPPTEEGRSVVNEEYIAKVSLDITTAQREMERVFCRQNDLRKIYFSQDGRLDFAFRRNIEHILSVCSIPIPVDHKSVPNSIKGPAIAITCGDIAGHRMGPRASL